MARILPAGVELRVPDGLAVGHRRASALVAGTPAIRSPARTTQLLDTLAAQCAIAAQRAALQARTADIAEQLQSSLAASPLPELERFELAVHYAPGGDDLEHVGGDWYDVVRTASGTLALVVGDVMGRGRAGRDHDDPGPGRDPWPAHRRPGSPGRAGRGRRDAEPRRARPVRHRGRGPRRPRDRGPDVCNAGHMPVVVVHPDGEHRGARGGLGRARWAWSGRLERTVVTGRLEPGRCW